MRRRHVGRRYVQASGCPPASTPLRINDTTPQGCRRFTAAEAPHGQRPVRQLWRGRPYDRMTPMEIGAVYPQNELRGEPSAVRRIGRGVEDLGFDYLLAYDHVLGAVHADRTPPLTGPYTEHDPFHDPFVMFAYLAGITKRIRFATGVVILPQRQTALVARQAADLDLLSGGRLRLGVGVGWSHVEYEALGQDFRTR